MNSNHLQGLCLLNTRPKGQNITLSQTIAKAGGRCIELPALEIKPTDGWFEHLPDMSRVTQAVFTSPNAVNYFFGKLTQQHVIWPNHIQVTAIGKASALTLSQWGIRVDKIPAISNSEHLVQLDAFQTVGNQTIMMVKGEEGRTLIADTLRLRGAHLIELAVYYRTLPCYSAHEINSLWHDDSVNIILFTSQQAIDNLFTLLGEEGRLWLCNKPCLVISERLAKAASLRGIKPIITSSYDSILDSLYIFYKQTFQKKNKD
ncbi:uroporphyrinogen-III synthase [Legionella oakridgensis ATCC 33761 = DSM 21215]|uniref:Uroporphyrinogen-III synthase n=1 Tax=Legionella oakridgensis ATCC 33761 = DSM 21215 TaxID=1268635 RepID=W0BBI5_9GAMM|nr:uroporphyrinogen-III synthase [Legionella oakridgensis]AHE66066.1 uroporphyrinogen-III synthase [Legionella oakridgensis ATCC 33761 = DSM 21215]